DDWVSQQKESLMSRAASLGSLGTVARRQGEEVAADAYFRDAFVLALEAANHAGDDGAPPGRIDLLQAAARYALDCGEVMEARRLVDEARSTEGAAKFADGWAELREAGSWPDAWLIAAVRRDPPDAQALDAV